MSYSEENGQVLLRHGYAKGRREIDKWWIEMDQQLDEEWAKIWREER